MSLSRLVPCEEVKVSNTRVGISSARNPHHSLGSALARHTAHSNPGISIHVVPDTARSLHHGDLSDSHRDNGLLDSVPLRSRFARAS
jgi:hypothetical protein